MEKMGTKVRSIERREVPGGVELTARGKSNRGTTYICGNVVVLRGTKSKAEWDRALTQAIDNLTGRESKLG